METLYPQTTLIEATWIYLIFLLINNFNIYFFFSESITSNNVFIKKKEESIYYYFFFAHTKGFIDSSNFLFYLSESLN